MPVDPVSGVGDAAGQAADRRAGLFQRRWLRIHWTGFAMSAVMLLIATTGVLSGETHIAQWVPTALGCVSACIGAVSATRLRRMGASDMWFVLGTGTARAIAVGWAFVGLAILAGGVYATAADIDTDPLVEPVAGVIGSLGAVALVAMIGPGYSEFREAKHAVFDTESGLEAARAARAARVRVRPPARSRSPRQRRRSPRDR